MIKELKQLYSKACEPFLNEPIEVLEKPIGLRLYEPNSYTPVEFARRYANEKTLEMLQMKLVKK